MRLTSVEVVNYKGIARASISDIHKEPVVMISGRNGTGKSLLLEAIVGAWTRRYDLQSRVGPWGTEMTIDLRVSLTDEEFSIVDEWHQRLHGTAASPQDSYRFAYRADDAGTSTHTHVDEVINILHNQTFQRQHPFGIIDFLSASRVMPATPSPTVDLAMLNVERVEQDRFNMLDRFINSRDPMSLPNVSSYLVTLDYQAFLAQRQGLAVTNEYERLREAFNEATGKNLLEPEYDPARGSNIEVEVAEGLRHGLRDLSSGEQEMLALFYFVRRLSAAGGVLCLDEPEQHLHPTLQAALFEGMRDVASRAQVLVVSHSVSLIAASGISGLVQMSAPASIDDNQASRLRDAPERTELISELGITPADLLQSDMLLALEGDTDAQWLRTMFPVEVGRAHPIVCGGSDQVLDAYETLARTPAGVPWLCLRDRDLLTEGEVEALRQDRPNLYLWPRRSIENMLLHAPLVAAVLSSVGLETSAEEAVDLIRDAAAPLRDEVLGVLVEKELTNRYPAPDVAGELDRFSRLEAHLRAYANVNQDRADGLAQVIDELRADLYERWPDEYLTIVDAKAALARLAASTGVFRSRGDLMNALVARSRDEEEVRPPGLEDFRARVSEVLEQ